MEVAINNRSIFSTSGQARPVTMQRSLYRNEILAVSNYSTLALQATPLRNDSILCLRGHISQQSTRPLSISREASALEPGQHRAQIHGRGGRGRTGALSRKWQIARASSVGFDLNGNKSLCTMTLPERLLAIDSE